MLRPQRRDDAAADAALLSEIVGKPVRVQWTRHDEHGWEPLGPAMVIDVAGGLDSQGNGSRGTIEFGRRRLQPPQRQRRSLSWPAPWRKCLPANPISPAPISQRES